MGFQQDTIIYIEDQDRLDASAAANSFADKGVKNRAYVNTLGAELALKYLASENIDVNDIYNIHSIKKILEELDISDIMLPNIHIDVRVVFDENIIFIPKSHFKYGLVPDIYLVLNLAKDFSHVKFLGFFEPKLINKNNQNNEYYFIEKEKLNPVSDLKNYIENYKGNTTSGASEQDIENSERIIIAMADNDISEDDKQYLIKQLTKSAELRDKFIEYENFETLSYKAMTDPQINKKEINIDTEIPKAENNTSDITAEPQFQADEANVTDMTSGLSELSDIGALAAEELLPLENTADAAVNITDTNIEIANDLIDSQETGSSEPITFDDIDTSALDNIPESDENNFVEETISFDDIDTQPQNVDVDYIDNIDNKISFDDINTGDEAADIDETIQPNEEETISLDNIDIQPQNDDVDYINNIDNKISFDDIDTGNETENIEETIQPNVEETISLDNIDTSFMDEVQNLPNIEEDTISLDDIETPDIRPDMELTENPDNNMISFEDIPEQDNTAPENSEDDINIADTTLPDNEENSSETIEQEIPDIENLTPDNFDDVNIEPYMDSLNPEDNIQTDSSIENISTIETNSDTVQNNTETGSFGQNLLENMTEENLNSIPIDELGLDETPTQNAEEITSDDLLSQIDDLLNSDDTTPQQPEQTQNEESIENVPDIDSLISDVNETELPETTPQQEPGYTETQEDNTNSDLDDIDALLNMSASDTGSDYQEENPSAEEDKLNVLYNDTDPASDSNIDNIETYDMQYDNPASQQQVPGQAFLKQKKSGNKTLITTAALITVLAGASAFVFLKPKSDSASDIEAAVPASSDIINTPEKSNSPENILETNAPDIDKSVTKKIQKTPQQVKELKNAPAAKKPISTDSYLEVKRLVWDVPDVLSYSPKIQNYLRTAGKSIKLSLSADLLLATEYAYSNQVKVNLTLNKNGSVQDAEIAASSGSTEIDNIVLQSVKDTLNVVKPPSSEISTPDFKLNLIIYF